MTCVSTVNLKNLSLKTNIGFYGSNDVIPKEHFLDMCLIIDSNLVLIENDGMEFVFDYDPLMKTINYLANDGHYHTQERLLTRIVHACAHYVEIQGVTLNLRKTPVLQDGSLGVEITVDNKYLNKLRSVT
jgi:dihydroneopterin aldolase